MPTEGHVFIATSLDGQIARADGGLDWLLRNSGRIAGEDYGYAAFIAGMDGVVMGSGSYRAVRAMGHWAYPCPVVVLTARAAAQPPPPDGARVSFSAETPAALMARLAARGWAAAYVDGGAVIRSFLRAGLIHELILTTVPVLIGAGRPLFGSLPGDVALQHLHSRSFPDGLVQARYRVRQP